MGHTAMGNNVYILAMVKHFLWLLNVYFYLSEVFIGKILHESPLNYTQSFFFYGQRSLNWLKIIQVAYFDLFKFIAINSDVPSLC